MSIAAAAPGPPGSSDRSEALTEFASAYDFPLDAFQVRACEALERGDGVLVAAPTGAGKTIVGEFAVHLALRVGQKCFYTTPIKALSNQKFADLTARYGPTNVGLLTGDNSINGDAPIVVMTTEVLRNMIYAGSSALRGLGYVVMDEVHYLSDRFRGAVWEEVIIHLPEHVRLVSLSATVSNTEEFADWLVTVRGHTQVVVEEHRPVPLWQHVLVGDRLHDLFVDRSGHHEPGHSDDVLEPGLRVNPELYRLAKDDGRFSRTGPRGPKGAPVRPQGRGRGVPSRVDVVNALDREGLLPVITFIFSRAGCQGAVEQFLRSGVRLIKPEERRLVRTIVESRTQDIPEEDRHVLGYYDWLEGLERGVAAHHAGMLPAFKEVVEELFSRGLVKAVFATETLALGINMPARSVVLEKLVKWNGEAHVDVTPGEYTQLTGRAGRRGIDVEGHGVVLWQPGLDPEAVAGLASTRTYPLRSSFRPSYNMAVNLVRTVGKARARALLESSFAQFQADRSVVGLARQVSRNQGALEGYAEAMTCHLGDFEEYFGYRVAIKEREGQLAREGASLRRAAAAKSLETLKTGDVVRIAGGRRAGLAVVLDPGLKDVGPDGYPRPVVLTQERQVKRMTAADFPDEAVVVDTVRVPRGFNQRSAQSRRDLAASLHRHGGAEGTVKARRTRALAADDQQLLELRRLMRQHPCHGCDEREDHARWAERHERLRRDTAEIERKVSGRTNTIARTFDRVCTVLDRLGYLEGGAVTAAGDQLARVYSESDLLVVECLRSAVWDRLTPAELAACVSALVYETRRADESISPRLPTAAVQDALQQMSRRWSELTELEDRHHLTFLREPDAGFAFVAHRWASGHRLDEVLTEADLTAGDFVRSMKQLMDLLGQIADVAAEDSPVRGKARAALKALRRGVVAYSSVT
ncbi:MAG: ATP-dependent helicase HelY [Frankiales bacterium]|jgi:ATP-dependent RNA helicase HelY|nr:ATP-dependent helicase HelY [Frankiales bacterium]